MLCYRWRGHSLAIQLPNTAWPSCCIRQSTTYISKAQLNKICTKVAMPQRLQLHVEQMCMGKAQCKVAVGKELGGAVLSNYQMWGLSWHSVMGSTSAEWGSAWFDLVVLAVDCVVPRTVSQLFPCDLRTWVRNWCRKLLNEWFVPTLPCVVG